MEVIRERNKPYAIAGLVAGLAFAFYGIGSREKPPAAPAVSTSPAPVLPSAPPAPPVARALPPLVPNAPPPMRLDEPIHLAFPGTAEGSSSGPLGGGSSSMEEGSIDDPAAALAKMRAALAGCGPVEEEVGDVTIVSCATAVAESAAVIEMGSAPRRAFTLEAKFAAPAAVPPKRAPNDEVLCGLPILFAALPKDAQVHGSGGSADGGDCGFEVPRPPEQVLRDLEASIFDVNARTKHHDFDDGSVARTVVWGASRGQLWRIDVARAPGGTSAGIMRLAPHGMEGWPVRVGSDELRAALKGCSAKQACARTLVHADLDDALTIGDAIDRCLWECDGQPWAPARVAPVDAFMPNHHR